MSALLGTPAGATAGGHTNPAELNGVSGITAPLNNFISNSLRNDPNNTTRPKAFINYILLDEQFKFAGGNFSAVSDNPNTVKSHYSDFVLQGIPVTKNGYLYVYVSNESPVNVLFDNLQVVHTRGAILEETHYYPFGLTMNGISSKALNFGKPENVKKYQQYELNTNFDINLYESFYRTNDPQLGRFWQIDPKPIVEMESLYSSMNNNPISNIDFLGDITYFYGSDGALLRSQADGNKYATITVIGEDRIDDFKRSAQVLDVSLEVDKKNGYFTPDSKVAAMLQGYGVSYDSKEYFDYYDKHSKDYYEGDVFKPTDGKGKLVNERMAGLELKDCYMRVMDKEPHPSSDNPTESDTNEIGDRDIHTHTTEGRSFTVNGNSGHVNHGKDAFGNAVDGGDLARRNFESQPEEQRYRKGVFDVVVTPTHVYLYRTGQVTISVDRNNVPSKNPGEIK